MAKDTLKPKFKTSWKNIHPIDTPHSIEIGEYGGLPLQIIEIEGKHILITLLKESKLEFLDPATLKKVDKTITLTTGKETVNRYKYRLINLKGEWCFIFLKSLEDKEYAYEVVYYNISTGQTKILDKVRCLINDLIIVEINNDSFLFIAYRCKNDQISKYDLTSLEKLADFSLPNFPDYASLYRMEGNKQPVLIIKYEDEDKQNHTIYLDPHTFSPLGDKDAESCNQTYIGENNKKAITTTSINNKVFIDTQFYALPTHNSEFKILEMETVDVGEGNKQLIIIVTFYQYPKNNQGDIKHQTHLLAFDADSKKQIYDILLCDDPENNQYIDAILYKTNLIFSISGEGKSINKMYDLTRIEKEPLIFRDNEGNADVGYNRDNCIVNYNGKDFIILHKYRNDTHRRYFSLDTRLKSDEMTGISDKYDNIYKTLPYKDPDTNRELFILECADYRPGSYKHITILHNPSGQAESDENLELYYQPIHIEMDK